MSTATEPLVVTRAVARRGSRTIARLRYAGKAITVVQPGGKAIGRLLPAGYLRGEVSADTEHFDVYTAKHPAVHTPSDTALACGLTVPGAIEFLLNL